MTVELTKEDLITLIKGVCPSYEAMEHPSVKSLGVYTGGFVDHWSWYENAVKSLSEDRLWSLYLICRDSRK
jgi:hypothetical protein